MKTKYIPIFLIIVSILGIIYSFTIITQEQKYLDVTDENREIIYNALNGKVKNINLIKKVAVGQGWHTGELYIYYKHGTSENIPIYEGAKMGNIDGYIRQNGYSLDNVALIIGFISIIICFSSIIYLRKIKNNTNTI